jgi:hypothetical protein
MSRISSKMKKLSALGAGVAVIAGGAVLGLSGPASAGTCGDNFNPTVPGAKAHWEISCLSGNKVRIEGWVEDTRSDGKCAKVSANINGVTKRSAAACPKGDREEFEWTANGRTINAELYTYDA